jgi:hypothetical protein
MRARGRVTGLACYGAGVGQPADRLLIRPASGRRAGTVLSARTHHWKDTHTRGHSQIESRTKSTDTNLTNAPDGTAHTLTVRKCAPGETPLDQRHACRRGTWNVLSSKQCWPVRVGPANRTSHEPGAVLWKRVTGAHPANTVAESPQPRSLASARAACSCQLGRGHA